MSPTQSRLALAGALASVLASLTLAPLLQGLGWLVAVIVVVAAVVGVGSLARSIAWPVVRWPVVVVALQLLALVLVMTGLFARDSALWGLFPGTDVIAEVHALITDGLGVTRQQAPPVTATRGVILLVTGGLGLVGLVVDVIAVTLQRPAVAGLPLLAVYCVPAAVLPGGLPWPYFVLGAGGFLVLVGADSGDRIRAWGRVLAPTGEETGDRALGGPLAGARRLAVGCLALATVLPVVVPGLGGQLFGAGGTGRGSGKGGNITVINPILNLRESLGARNDDVVIRYRTTATAPEPLRIVSDDVFDGNQWAPSVGPIPRDNRVQDGLPTAPGLSSSTPFTRLGTQIEVLDLKQTYLPLPYPSTKVDIDGPWLFDSRTLNVVGDNVTTRNVSYAVQHEAVVPTPQELRDAPSPPVQVASTFTQLPPALPREIGDIARRVAGNGSGYDQAVALQEYFRHDGGFAYDINIPAPRKGTTSGEDAVLAFLRTKQGYCVQFASAMAVMARTLGIPSRVAVGFLPGTQRSDGTWEISVRDAHAWPELYFQGVGWVRFEPTPATRTGQPPDWAVPPPTTTPTTRPSASASASPNASGVVPKDNTPPDRGTARPTAPLWQRVIGAVPWRLVVVLLVLLALAAVPLATSLLVRRVRWQRARTASGRVEAAWEDLRQRLEDLGVRWAVSWTPRALQLRLVSDYRLGGSVQAALARLVVDVEQVRYAPPGASVREAVALRADIDEVIAGVAASPAVEVRTRRRARWLPASGLRTLSSLARRADIAADQAGRRVTEVSSNVKRVVGRR